VSAGVGALAFAALTFVASIVANLPGGTYKASNVADFVKNGHRPLVFVSIYLFVLGVLGLVLLLARLRDVLGPGRAGSIFWALGVSSAGALLAGFVLATAVPLAMGYGGSKQVILDPKVTYVFSEAGWAVLAGAGATLLGLALLTLVVAKAALPSWLRWATLVGAVAALAGLAFFPLALVLIWSLVTGIWLLVAAPQQVAEVGTQLA
jgi:hypothetical protein